ncbi:MAG: hypothetical protein R2779_01215 [Crocinitomicaceae bacterium]
MNYKIIIILSSIGLIMGLLTVKGFTQKIEPFLWLLFGIATSLVLSKNIDEKTFLHGLIIGLTWGIINGMIQSAFFDTYISNNPQLQQSFSKSTFIQPRYFVLATGPIIGLITGLVLGGLSVLLKKIG